MQSTTTNISTILVVLGATGDLMARKIVEVEKSHTMRNERMMRSLDKTSR